MACFRLHGDDSGETHLTAIDLPVKESHAGRFRGLNNIPVTTMGFAEFIGRKPDVGDAPLMLMAIGIDEAWEGAGA